MSNLLWKSLLASPAILGATLVVSTTAIAAPISTTDEVVQPEVAQTQIEDASAASSIIEEAASATTSSSHEDASVAAVKEVASNSAIAPAEVATTVNEVATETAPAEVATTVNEVATETSSAATVEPKEAASAIDTATNPVIPETAAVSTPEFSPAPQPKVLAQAAPVEQLTVTPVAAEKETNVLDQVNRYGNEGRSNTLSQVTSVSQFSDVQPTDWAFQALQSLVERYGCIAGYPDSTYRGNRALTRYEFAAGLNACLDRINELIATATADLVTKEDLATLQRLQEEFSAELATLRGRVDALEARTAELEANQFSTTTKLVGEAIFALTDTLGEAGEDTNTVFGNRVRLEFQSSFTGRDILHTRIAASNLDAFGVGNAVPTASDLNRDGVAGDALSSSEGFQTFNLGPGNNNRVTLDWLAYEFPFGASKVYLAATGGLHADYTPTLNPYFYDADGGNGSLSVFAQQSPIYRIGGGAGGGISFRVGQAPLLGPTSLTVGYLADSGSNPGRDFGIGGGDYGALAQLNFTVSDRLGIAATYVHGYHNGGNPIFDAGTSGRNPNAGIVGTSFANLPRDLGGNSNPGVTNSYGLQAAFRLSNALSISGFAMYTDFKGNGIGDDDQIWSYGAGLALPDLGGRGNILGIFAGAQPYSGNRSEVGNRRGEIPYHLEAFYKYRLTDNISVTPGVIWLTNPNQSGNADDAVIGTLRTTFTF